MIDSEGMIVRKLTLMFVALFCLQAAALAAPDSVVTGPYKVSFDMGVPVTDYMATTSDPTTAESLSGDVSTDYKINIKNKIGMTKFAQVDLTYRPKGMTLPSESDLLLIANNAIQAMPQATNVQTATRPIDGTYGGVASYDYRTDAGYFKMYSLTYFPISEEGYIQVIITSAYPWENGTLQLFRTFHLEKTSLYSKPFAGPTSAYAGHGLGAMSGQDSKNLLTQP